MWNSAPVEELNFKEPSGARNSLLNFYFYTNSLYHNGLFRSKVEVRIPARPVGAINTTMPQRRIDTVFRMANAPVIKTLVIEDNEGNIIALYDVVEFYKLNAAEINTEIDVHVIAERVPIPADWYFHGFLNGELQQSLTLGAGNVHMPPARYTRITQNLLETSGDRELNLGLKYPFTYDEKNVLKTKIMTAEGDNGYVGVETVGKFDADALIRKDEFSGGWVLLAVYIFSSGNTITTAIGDGGSYTNQDYQPQHFIFYDYQSYGTNNNGLAVRINWARSISKIKFRQSDEAVDLIKLFLIPAVLFLPYARRNSEYTIIVSGNEQPIYDMQVGQTGGSTFYMPTYMTIYFNNLYNENYRPFPFFVNFKLYLSGQTIEPPQKLFKYNVDNTACLVRHSAVMLELKGDQNGQIALTLLFVDSDEKVDITAEFTLPVSSNTASEYLAQNEQAESARRTSGILNTIGSVLGLIGSAATGNPIGIAAAVGGAASITSLYTSEATAKERANRPANIAYGITTGRASIFCRHAELGAPPRVVTPSDPLQIHDTKLRGIFDFEIYQDGNLYNNVFDIINNGYLCDCALNEVYAIGNTFQSSRAPFAFKTLEFLDVEDSALLTISNGDLDEFIDITRNGMRFSSETKISLIITNFINRYEELY